MANPDHADAHGHGGGEPVQTDGHGDGHGDPHGGEALGPIDVMSWAAAVLGIALGLLVVVALVWSLT